MSLHSEWLLARKQTTANADEDTGEKRTLIDHQRKHKLVQVLQKPLWQHLKLSHHRTAQELNKYATEIPAGLCLSCVCRGTVHHSPLTELAYRPVYKRVGKEMWHIYVEEYY